MIQKLENPTTDKLFARIEQEYSQVLQHLIEDNSDIEQVKFMRGKLAGLRYVAELLGQDITLVPKQEGVKA
jgi:hypothetical protein